MHAEPRSESCADREIGGCGRGASCKSRPLHWNGDTQSESIRNVELECRVEVELAADGGSGRRGSGSAPEQAGSRRSGTARATRVAEESERCAIEGRRETVRCRVTGLRAVCDIAARRHGVDPRFDPAGKPRTGNVRVELPKAIPGTISNDEPLTPPTSYVLVDRLSAAPPAA